MNCCCLAVCIGAGWPCVFLLFVLVFVASPVHFCLLTCVFLLVDFVYYCWLTVRIVVDWPFEILLFQCVCCSGLV